jgi:hypothetical protein
MIQRAILVAGSVVLLCVARGAPAQDGGGKGGRAGGDLRQTQGPGVAAGTAAPDFALKTVDGKSRWKLSAFKGKQPVALIFGSYT